jgi:hypothetical protein
MGGAAPFQAMTRIDTNKDQKISKDEMLAQFAKVDVDKDGQVTRGEIMQVMMAGRHEGDATRKPKDAGKSDSKALRRRAPKFEKKSEPKPAEKKPAVETPKTEKPPEAKPAEPKPAEEKATDGSTRIVEPIVAVKPAIVHPTSPAPVEAVRPKPATAVSENSQNDAANEPESAALPST